MMDLLANEYILPNPTPSQEPDEFELFLRAVEQFSAHQFIEKAEQVQVSEESLCYLQSSVERKEELISETLADLLAQQGKTRQAVQMYERLSAQQPQKQAIFLSKIKQLQP